MSPFRPIAPRYTSHTDEIAIVLSLLQNPNHGQMEDGIPVPWRVRRVIVDDDVVDVVVVLGSEE